MINTWEETDRLYKMINDIKDIISPFAKINGYCIFNREEIKTSSQFKEFYRMYRYASTAMSFGKEMDTLMEYLFSKIDRYGNTYVDFNEIENIILNNNKKVVK